MRAVILGVRGRCRAGGTASADKFLGRFDKWEAHRGEGNDLFCFIATLPAKSEGKLAKRGEATLMVAHFPKRRAFGQVQVKARFRREEGRHGRARGRREGGSSSRPTASRLMARAPRRTAEISRRQGRQDRDRHGSPTAGFKIVDTSPARRLQQSPRRDRQGVRAEVAAARCGWTGASRVEARRKRSGTLARGGRRTDAAAARDPRAA